MEVSYFLLTWEENSRCLHVGYLTEVSIERERVDCTHFTVFTNEFLFYICLLIDETYPRRTE